MRELPDDMIGNSIRALLGSGMRVQELLALRQEDIDTDGATIRITKAVEMVDGKPVLGSPKSEHSNRVIPIPEYYRSAVRYIREHGSKIYLWISRRENFLCSISEISTMRSWTSSRLCAVCHPIAAGTPM